MANTEARRIQQYTGFLLWPVVLAALLHMVALNIATTTMLVIATHAVLDAVICVRTVQLRAPWTVGAVAGGLAGAVVAAIAALYKLVDTFNVVTAFNLFTEPLLTGVLDAIATGAITLISLWMMRHLYRRTPSPSATTGVPPPHEDDVSHTNK